MIEKKPSHATVPLIYALLSCLSVERTWDDGDDDHTSM
jgi:hypothetical protein